MSVSERFRRNAEECRDLARTAKTADERQGLLDLADWWEERARHFEERDHQRSGQPPDDPPPGEPKREP